MRALLIALAVWLFAAGSALAQSTIVPTVPAQNSPLNSAPIRGNFLAAYNDINGILGMHPASTTGGCPVSPLVGTDCLVTTSASVYTWYKFTGSTAGYGSVATVNRTTGQIQVTATCANCALVNANNFFSAAQTINLNAHALQSAQTGTLLQVGNANGVVSRIEADSYAAAAHFSAVRADGTAASPTTLQSGDNIGSFNAWGCCAGGTTFAGPQAALRFYASQNWSSGALGTFADIALTAAGSSTLTPYFNLSSAGLNLGAGASTAGNYPGAFLTVQGGIASVINIGGTFPTLTTGQSGGGGHLLLWNALLSGEADFVNMFRNSGNTGCGGFAWFTMSSQTAVGTTPLMSLPCAASGGTTGGYMTLATGGNANFAFQSANTGNINQLTIQNSGAYSTVGTESVFLANLSGLASGYVYMAALGGSTPSAIISSASGLTGGLTIGAASGLLALNSPLQFNYGTGSAQTIVALSTNTGFVNALYSTNGGTLSNSGTAAQIVVNLSAGTNAYVAMQVGGGGSPLAQLYSGTGMTGGLTIGAQAGQLVLNAPLQVTLGTGSGQNFYATSPNTGFLNQFAVINTGTTSNSATQAIVYASLNGAYNVSMGAYGGSTPIGQILSGASLTGGLTIAAGAGPLTLVTPTLAFGTGGTSLISATSLNTGFANVFDSTNSGTTSNTGTLAGFSAQLTGAPNIYVTLQILGGANPAASLYNGPAATGGLNILANGGTLSLATPTLTGTVTMSALTTAGLVTTTSGGVISSEAQATLAQGGTNASLTASNGGIVYSGASAFAVLAGTVTAGQCLLSGSSAAPTWGSCAGGAAVSSVGNATSDTTLTIAGTGSGPWTGAVTVKLNLGNANTWSGAQTFGNGDLLLAGSSSGSSTLEAPSTGGGVVTFQAGAYTVAGLNIADQTLAGGVNVTSDSLATGSFTVDCGLRPLQYQTGTTSAETITAPANDGSCIIQYTNVASGTPGAVTLSGFAVNASYTGAVIDTTNSHKFMIAIQRVNGSSIYQIIPQQ